MALPQTEIRSAFESELPVVRGDADVDASRLRFYLTSGTTPAGAESIPAWLWPPGYRIDSNSSLMLDQRAEAERAKGLYRLEFHLDFSQPDALSADGTHALVGGLIRHEVEHIRQHDACGHPPIQLHHFAIEGIREEQGRVPFEILRESPIELDANAGSAAYLRKHHVGQMEAIAATKNHGNLVTSKEPPEPYEMLTNRMVGFLFQFRHGFDRYIGGTPIDAFLADQVSEGAAASWRALAT